MNTYGGKVEQFVDIIQNHPANGDIIINTDFLDNTLYKYAAQAKYSELPTPFCLKSEPKVPYSMQFVIVPSSLPPDQDHEYVDIFKHIYLHRNKVPSNECMSYCQGIPVRFDWGSQVRLGLTAMNYMLDLLTDAMAARLARPIAAAKPKKRGDEESYDDTLFFEDDFWQWLGSTTADYSCLLSGLLFSYNLAFLFSR